MPVFRSHSHNLGKLVKHQRAFCQIIMVNVYIYSLFRLQVNKVHGVKQVTITWLKKKPVYGRKNPYCIIFKLLLRNFIGNLITSTVDYFLRYSPVSWNSRIHRLLSCREVRPRQNECIAYGVKPSDDKVPMIVELWGMQSSPS